MSKLIVDAAEREMLDIKLEPDDVGKYKTNNYQLRYPSGAAEKISTVSAIQFLVAQKQLKQLKLLEKITPK